MSGTNLYSDEERMQKCAFCLRFSVYVCAMFIYGRELWRIKGNLFDEIYTMMKYFRCDYVYYARFIKDGIFWADIC
jgi:hypothetical protein